MFDCPVPPVYTRWKFPTYCGANLGYWVITCKTTPCTHEPERESRVFVRELQGPRPLRRAMDSYFPQTAHLEPQRSKSFRSKTGQLNLPKYRGWGGPRLPPTSNPWGAGAIFTLEPLISSAHAVRSAPDIEKNILAASITELYWNLCAYTQCYGQSPVDWHPSRRVIDNHCLTDSHSLWGAS